MLTQQYTASWGQHVSGGWHVSYMLMSGVVTASRRKHGIKTPLQTWDAPTQHPVHDAHKQADGILIHLPGTTTLTGSRSMLVGTQPGLSW